MWQGINFVVIFSFIALRSYFEFGMRAFARQGTTTNYPLPHDPHTHSKPSPSTTSQQVARRRSKYRCRPGEDLEPGDKIRAFGGVNMLLFGDWYQLKPVNGTALYGYTLDAPSETSRARKTIE